MIQINVPNIITIGLCGALGYALVAGFPKLRAAISKSAAVTANATA